ncbi:NADP-dependent oxidoreductase domain-containing protein [Russula ochroleuca]|jgi:pyridoxine 4-dehydrogenase|uniref:NADP-dependent oxidoreductase domain-containing protein n=1 Tax=Russula ochroleuca TaxID=152965 RepID=A0A9P5JVF5_9AGAM|nr:NADP-dependent oxidoreductase domain-containing protein [Russula ochroleuca]
MAHTTAKIGGPASGVVVAKVGHGLMRMTATTTPVRDEQAFAAIKGGIDALPQGVKMFLNSSEFYGQGLTTANLELLARFFEKYPDYADRTFLSVKGGFVPGRRQADGSRENLRRSVDTILKCLRGTKKLDLFEPARLDWNYTIEHYAEVLNELVKEGKFDYIGLSAVGEETVRRAHKVMSVAAVEIEVSLLAYGKQTKDVIAICKKLDISVIAYGPLGRGLLTDRGGDSRHQDDFLDTLSKIANRIGITLAQLSIAWVGSLGDHVIPLPGSSKLERTLENLRAGDVKLAAEDLEDIAQLLKKHPGEDA